MSKATTDHAIALAQRARENAYAPYSRYLVGACVKAKGQEEYFVGCNVENACYNAGICAERAALSAFVAQLGEADVEFLVLVTQSQPPAPPCGLCRQFLSEFFSDDTPVILTNPEGERQTFRFGDLFPHNFTKKDLNR